MTEAMLSHQVMVQVEELRQRLLMLMDTCDRSLNLKIQHHDPRIEASQSSKGPSMANATATAPPAVATTGGGRSLASAALRSVDTLLSTPRQFEDLLSPAKKKMVKLANPRVSQSLQLQRSSQPATSMEEVALAAMMMEDMQTDLDMNSAELNEMTLLGRHMSLQHAYGLVAYRSRKLLDSLQVPMVSKVQP